MLKTEMRNEKSLHIDTMDTASMVALINEENRCAVEAVAAESAAIAEAIDKISDLLGKGGRLFYIGAGTSGRIGVMDAAECPPTFGVEKDRVVAIIAGGEKCLSSAAENSEDDGAAGESDLAAHGAAAGDAVVGISAAGGAEYVVRALEYARRIGAFTVALTSNAGSPVTQAADISICPDTGAEVVTGSTRMKAGTAQKLILNTISTCAMIKCGYVYENLMINLRPQNRKLRDRMCGIVSDITGWTKERAETALEENGWDIRRTVTGNEKKTEGNAHA